MNKNTFMFGEGTCTCLVADMGSAQVGPHITVAVHENCPQHGAQGQHGFALCSVEHVSIDRPHRYEVGDKIAHRDSVPHSAVARVEELTWTVRAWLSESGDEWLDATAYPTYTLVPLDDEFGSPMEDILDTDDLVEDVEDELASREAHRDDLLGLEKEARRLRVPMTHTIRDAEYVDVLAYRVEQELRAARERVTALEQLSTHHMLAAARRARAERTASESCTCSHEEGGDAESGPRMYVTPDEWCPLHGRAALPKEWAEEDEMERGYVHTNVWSVVGLRLVPNDPHGIRHSYDQSARALHERRREASNALMKDVDDEMLMRMFHAALSRYEDGVEDDGHDGDRAITDVADALIVLLRGRGEVTVTVTVEHVPCSEDGDCDERTLYGTCKHQVRTLKTNAGYVGDLMGALNGLAPSTPLRVVHSAGDEEIGQLVLAEVNVDEHGAVVLVASNKA